GEGLGEMSGMKAPMRGTFTKIVEPERLVFSNNALDEAGNVLLSGETSVTFEDEGGKTKMTIRTSAEGTAPGTDMMLAGMEQGWNEQTDKLGEFLSK
ncbi:MAG TPA: SRPBCC domain-containing protein, partial [Candidatus Paceibacterota bacterium]|nr:SRPBCC domain-containing protein [Candidatus Paceibacterota bacterium]